MATFYAALGSQYRLELYVNEDPASINIAANTSNVNFSLYIRKLSGSGRFTYSNDSWGININGWSATGGFLYDFRDYSLLLLTSNTLTVVHETNGSKTISVSGTFNDVQGNLGAGTAYGSLALSTIPRASTVTFELAGAPVTAADAGVSVTLKTNRADASFTHTLTYDFAGLTAQPIATGVGASVTHTFPLALLNEIPNALSGPLTVRAATYSGATLIGTKTSVLTLKVPPGADYEPDFGTVTNSETVTVVATNVGAYVQGFTKLALAITSPTAPYSATVASFKITAAGQTISTQAGTLADPIALAGTVAIVGTVTDSRGRTHSETVNVTVLPYSLPSVSAAQLRRALSGGTLDEDGTYVRADLTAAVQSLIVSAVQKNALTINAFTRERGTIEWGTAAATITPGAITYASHFEFGVYSVGKSYELQLIISDVLGGVVYVNATITTGGVFIHFGGNGEGLAVGKYWEQGSVDALGRIYQNNGEPVQSAIAATETAMGPVELANNAETLAGLDLVRALTPATLKAFMDAYTADHRAPYRYEAGITAINTASGSSASGIFWNAVTSITFAVGRFSVVPLMKITIVDTTGGGGSVMGGFTTEYLTKDGFSVRPTRLGAAPPAAYRIHWEAVQWTELSATG